MQTHQLRMKPHCILSDYGWPAATLAPDLACLRVHGAGARPQRCQPICLHRADVTFRLAQGIERLIILEYILWDKSEVLSNRIRDFSSRIAALLDPATLECNQPDWHCVK
jgi:hypothetical protein